MLTIDEHRRFAESCAPRVDDSPELAALRADLARALDALYHAELLESSARLERSPATVW